MKRALLILLLVTITGCKDPSGDSHAAAAGSSSASAAPSAPAEPSFRGTYRSAWGDTVFTQAGAVVVARYPAGSLDCMASGATLDCSWTEGSAHGKARLTRQANGTIQGTWGNVLSDQDGGQWTFVPK